MLGSPFDVLSWRLAFLAGALAALTQVLRANHVIGHLASVVVVVRLSPSSVVPCSWCS
ncbi:hypothetical protein [Micromonospora zamorensis]|uniref:hypothetical protein n=1 Tax=Micromonospora zamorensis TaxID=709883 RepID=UPI0033A3F3A5